MGGKLHLTLNIDRKPIANKYREGNVKRTLKRGSKVLEISVREGILVGTRSKEIAFHV